jgi:phosphoglycerate dehydrogenase-like enzyme
VRTIKSAFFNNGTSFIGTGVLDQVYGKNRQWIAANSELYPTVIGEKNFAEHADQLAGLEVIFSTWGMPKLTAAQLDRMPRLKCVFYAAGATRDFRGPLVERGIVVCSATAANAIPVAEFCLGQILLANTGYFRNTREFKRPLTPDDRKALTGPGNYGGRVALIGAGTIAQKLQELLAPFRLDVRVVASRAERRTMSLEEAFATSYVVSNHLPDRDDNVGVLNAALFRLLPHGATFVNTGRGRQIDHAGLVEVLRERPDLTALLDVQYPEPPEAGSALYELPNVLLSSHIAGSKRDELIRMSDYMVADFKRYLAGEPLVHVVQPDQL